MMANIIYFYIKKLYFDINNSISWNENTRKFWYQQIDFWHQEMIIDIKKSKYWYEQIRTDFLVLSNDFVTSIIRCFISRIELLLISRYLFLEITIGLICDISNSIFGKKWFLDINNKIFHIKSWVFDITWNKKIDFFISRDDFWYQEI